MFRPLRILTYCFTLLLIGACQGHGRSGDAPLASYPGSDSAVPESAAPRPTEPGPSEATARPPTDPRSDEAAPASGHFAEPPRDTPAGNPGESAALPRAQVEAEESKKALPEPPPSAARTDNFDVALNDRASTGAPAPRAPTAAPNGPRAQTRQVEPRERPGLATHWGEDRYSPIEQVEFLRASSNRPCALAEIHYDDRAGARRLVPDGAPATSELRALGGLLELSMVDASGRPFPALRQAGHLVVLGEPGERYALRVENRSNQRYEIVATVDGLDVIDGETGNLGKRGYLVEAHGSVVIDGFRRSNEQVAAFRLGDVARSYADSEGKARNVGVIGFALFGERNAGVVAARPPRWDWEDTRLRQTAQPFPGSDVPND
jgi:hypothetical protein